MTGFGRGWYFAAVACAWAALGNGGTAGAADPAGAAADAPRPAASPPPAPVLSERQRIVAEKFRRLEEVMLRIAELSAPTDPKRAALLRRAIAQAKDRAIAGRFDELVELLTGDKLALAVTGQEELRADLDALLELLLSEQRGDRIKEEKARLREQLRKLNELINKQTELQGQSAGDAAAPEQLAPRQGQLADDAGKLAQDIEQSRGPLGGSTAKPGEPSSPGAPQPPGKEKPQEGDAPADGGQPSGNQPPRPGDQPDAQQRPADGERKPGGEKPPGRADKPAEGQRPPGSEKPPQDQPPGGQKPSPGPSQPGESKPGEGKSPAQGSPQPGQPGQPGQPSESDQPGEEPPPEGARPDDRRSAQRHVEAARQRMQRAQERLEKAEREGAVEEQEAALRELEQAKADLERILRQLREEEAQRLLAMLEERFREMLRLQREVYEGTVRLDKVPAAERGRNDALEAGRLSRVESQILLAADQALALLREEGSAVAFPVAIEQLRADIERVVVWLAEAKVGPLTQELERDIMAQMEEMIAAFQKAQRDKPPPPKPGQGGEPGEPPLIDQLAELKIIRSLQVRVNQRTRRYMELVSGEEGQAREPDLIEAIRELAQREERIYRTTRDIVTGKNE